MACFALAALDLPGCANNPVTAAKTSAQRAYALYGLFVIVEEQGAQTVLDPNVPPEIKRAIRTADAKAKPTADTLQVMLQQYQAAQAAVASGSGSADQLAIANANLSQWITQAETDINALVTAVHNTAVHSTP
jgi:hypothetical protein